VVLVVSAVDVHIELPSVAAAECYVAYAGLCRVKAADGPRLGQDRRQGREGSVKQRQIPNLSRSYYASDFGASGFNQGCGAMNFDGCSDTVGLQLEIESRLDADINFEALLKRARKTFGFHRYFVLAGSELAERVLACISGGSRATPTGFRVLCGHHSAGHR